MTRILIADDHDLIRQGLRKVLEERPGWTICGEAITGREAVAKATELRPNVVVLDVGMPELNGLEATRQIRRALPDTEVLILTMHDSERLAREALAVGARGFLLKTDLGDTVVTAVEHLRRHQPFFTSKVAELVLEGYLKPVPAESAQGGGERLTPREREIVQLLAEGKSNKEVASALGNSVHTVETHRSNIMRKLEVRSMSELVRYAIREHIIQA
jgi:DNA-binding NarL/FixJ family response regulator